MSVLGEDTFSQHFPLFPEYSQNITIRQTGNVSNGKPWANTILIANLAMHFLKLLVLFIIMNCFSDETTPVNVADEIFLNLMRFDEILWNTSSNSDVCPCLTTRLTHWGQDKMDAISWMTFSNAFSWMTVHEFWLQFHWNLFLRVQLTIFQCWFR